MNILEAAGEGLEQLLAVALWRWGHGSRRWSSAWNRRWGERSSALSSSADKARVTFTNERTGNVSTVAICITIVRRIDRVTFVSVAAPRSLSDLFETCGTETGKCAYIDFGRSTDLILVESALVSTSIKLFCDFFHSFDTDEPVANKPAVASAAETPHSVDTGGIWVTWHRQALVFLDTFNWSPLQWDWLGDAVVVDRQDSFETW